MESNKTTLQKTDNRLGTRERREEILKVIENLGLWNASRSALAKKFGVSRQTIHTDMKAILKNVSFDVSEIKINIGLSYKRCLSECMRIINNNSSLPGAKINAVNAVNNTNKGFIDMLESFGIKDKIADQLSVSSANVTVDGKLTKDQKAELLDFISQRTKNDVKGGK